MVRGNQKCTAIRTFSDYCAPAALKTVGMSITQATSNRVSDLNYLVSPSLTAGNEITGTFEPCFSFASMTVYIECTSVNKIGYLHVETSRDGATVTKTHAFRVMSIPGVNHLGKVLKWDVVAPAVFVRLRFESMVTNDSRTSPEPNTWTNLKIHTMFHVNKVDDDKADFIIGRQIFRVTGYAFNHTNLTCLLSGSSIYFTTRLTYPLPTAGTTARVYSDSTHNGISKKCARTFLVVGLDSNFKEVYWFGDFTPSNENKGYGLGVAQGSHTDWLRMNEFYTITHGPGAVPADGAGIEGTVRVDMYIASAWVTVNHRTMKHLWANPVAIYTVPSNYTSAKIVSAVYSNNSAYSWTKLGMWERIPGTTTTSKLQRIAAKHLIINELEEIKYPSGFMQTLPGDTYFVEIEQPGSNTVFSMELRVELC